MKDEKEDGKDNDNDHVENLKGMWMVKNSDFFCIYIFLAYLK